MSSVSGFDADAYGNYYHLDLDTPSIVQLEAEINTSAPSNMSVRAFETLVAVVVRRWSGGRTVDDRGKGGEVLKVEGG